MDFHLSLDNSKFVILDNDNKMKSACKDGCTRIECAIHYVNKQLEHSFTTDIIDKVPVQCEIVQEMFTHIRKIVSHTTRAHNQSKLSRQLQTYSDTRFNGAFYTINVFLLVFDELIGILDRTLMNNDELIDKDLLSYICTFLRPFDEILEQFSSDTKPTLNKAADMVAQKKPTSTQSVSKRFRSPSMQTSSKTITMMNKKKRPLVTKNTDAAQQ